MGLQHYHVPQWRQHAGWFSALFLHRKCRAQILTASVDANNADKLPNDNELETGKKPKFGARPDFQSPDFNFKKELEQLPFPMNIGEVDMSPTQQKQFLELIYDHQAVFSLCDEDLGLFDCLKHTIPTTTDKPVYLPHWTIPVQLQMEVHKCLDTWLWQGIIRPSHSPYALQVVIVHKKNWGNPPLYRFLGFKHCNCA